MDRYTLIRIYYKKEYYGSLRQEDRLDFKTLTEAIYFGSIVITDKEKEDSYILDNVNNKKLNLNGEYI